MVSTFKKKLLKGTVIVIMISNRQYRHFMNMTFDLSRSHNRFFVNFSKTIRDTDSSCITDLYEIIYELSFNAMTYDLG